MTVFSALFGSNIVLLMIGGIARCGDNHDDTDSVPKGG